MNQQQLIDLATKHGLIFLTDEHPKTLPAHQRLLSKLEKFAENIQEIAIVEFLEANANSNLKLQQDT